MLKIDYDDTTDYDCAYKLNYKFISM